MPIHSATTSGQNSLPGPDNILRQELDNGIVILSRANMNTSSIVISGNLIAGSLFDSDEKLGLANFCASSLLRGTHRHNFIEIYDQLESIGASLGFSAGTHLVSFSGKALVEDLDLLLSLLSEALRQPTFPEEQVERLRAQWLTSLAIRSQNTAEQASLAFDEIVYRDHPYRRPEDGYPETIQAIQQADLVGFHNRHYGPRGMLFSIVGGIEPDLAIAKVRQTFEDWQNTDQPAPPQILTPSPLPSRIIKHIPVPGKSQSNLVIGAAGPARISPDYLASSLGNHILGRFGMMGRLGETVREKAGLAYQIHSSLSGGIGPGPWEILAGLDPANILSAVKMILAEITRFVNEPVTQQELSDTQANYIGRLPISFESNAGIASALITLERYQLGLDYYLHYPGLVNSITPQDILQAANRYLDPEKLAIVSAGIGDGSQASY
jgi:zinc protease